METTNTTKNPAATWKPEVGKRAYWRTSDPTDGGNVDVERITYGGKRVTVSIWGRALAEGQIIKVSVAARDLSAPRRAAYEANGVTMQRRPNGRAMFIDPATGLAE